MHYNEKCPDPYVREEVLERQFSELMGQLRFDEDMLAWVKTALLDSHHDEVREREQAMRRHRTECDTLQKRIDGMYVDKLDGGSMRGSSTEWPARGAYCSLEAERRMRVRA